MSSQFTIENLLGTFRPRLDLIILLSSLIYFLGSLYWALLTEKTILMALVLIWTLLSKFTALLSKMVPVLCEQHLFLPLLRAFEMFLPSCSLLLFIRAFQAFSQMHLFEASAHLGSFSTRIKEESTRLPVNVGRDAQIGTSWISSTSIKAANAMLLTCPSPYEKRCLLLLTCPSPYEKICLLQLLLQLILVMEGPQQHSQSLQTTYISHPRRCCMLHHNLCHAFKTSCSSRSVSEF